MLFIRRGLEVTECNAAVYSFNSVYSDGRIRNGAVWTVNLIILFCCEINDRLKSQQHGGREVLSIWLEALSQIYPWDSEERMATMSSGALDRGVELDDFVIVVRIAHCGWKI